MMSRIDAFEGYVADLCETCKFYGNRTPCSPRLDQVCEGCPMHYNSRFSSHRCHCLATATNKEIEEKMCKFYKRCEE